MMLITKALAKRLPPLYATENDPDPMVQCVFFLPFSSWYWYGIEFDGTDIFFGYVVGHYPELGYFSLKELLMVRDAYGLPVERDRSFVPCRLSELRARLAEERS